MRAWAHLDPAQVKSAAEAIDAALLPGALAGLLVGVKDVILTADMPTRYNTNLPDSEGGRVDAACVAALRAAGALIVGKTETVEFGAIGRHAPTRNPHDFTRTPGGSSSGSAAAVADGHVPVALGTQTGGSMIRPASFCGVYGFKPSWGLVGNEGAKSFSPSLDTIGWFGATLDDVVRVLDIFDSAPGPKLGVTRIGVCRTPMWAHALPETHAALEHATRLYREAGAEVRDLELPPAFDGLHEAHSTIMRAEGGRTFLADARRHGETLHPNLLGLVRDLDTLDLDRLRRAYDLAASCRVAFDDLAGGFDAVLAPSATGKAPDRAVGTGDYVFNGMWTLLHTPCLNLPLYRTEGVLPVGVTLTGARFSDRRVVRAGELARR